VPAGAAGPGAPAAGAPARPRRARRDPLRVARPATLVLVLAPLALLLLDALLGRLGANPIERVTHWTGTTALTLLLATLAVTPVRRLTGWNRIAPLRRTLGLAAFFYAMLHFLTYVALDLFFDFGLVAEDILKRPYITVGFAAFLLLVPLAVTSTRGWIRRLGRNWQRLHRLVYAAAGLAVLHYFWKVKADTARPLLFAGALALLLVLRLPVFARPRPRARRD
jgi:sulfoxide reductase heme-binding subunit YedZ